MGFARQFVVIWILVAMTLLVQSAGLAVLIHWARAAIARGMHGLTPWRTSVLMIRFTVAMIVLTIVEIVLWAVFYRWQCFPTWEPSFYFSAASYSTVGYGDVVLPNIWRTLPVTVPRKTRQPRDDVSVNEIGKWSDAFTWLCTLPEVARIGPRMNAQSILCPASSR